MQLPVADATKYDNQRLDRGLVDGMETRKITRTSHGLGEFDAHLPQAADAGNSDNGALAGLVPTQRV